jgi:hypothetical protein
MSLFSKEEIISAGACPNCWGEQEYDELAQKMMLDKQIDINNHEARHSFIKEFVVNHISGIHLQKAGNIFQCPRCHKMYRL